jgi:hypothetical protein
MAPPGAVRGLGWGVLMERAGASGHDHTAMSIALPNTHYDTRACHEVLFVARPLLGPGQESAPYGREQAVKSYSLFRFRVRAGNYHLVSHCSVSCRQLSA